MKSYSGNIKYTLYCCIIVAANFLYAQEPKLVLPIGHTSPISTVQYSPDGKFIVTASWDNTAKVWDATEAKLLNELKGHTASLTGALFSPDGKKIITISKDNTARVWPVFGDTSLIELKGHQDWVADAAFSPNGKLIVTASWDNTAKLWNADNGHLIRTLKAHKGPIHAVSFSPDGKYILTASKDSTTILWRTANGMLLKKIHKHSDWVTTAVFSTDNKYAITASKDGLLTIWDIQKRELLKKLQAHTSGINHVSLSKDGHYILTASDDSTATIWLFPQMKIQSVLKNHLTEIKTAAFSPNGNYIIIASKNQKAGIWQTNNGQLLYKLTTKSDITSMAWSPDGNYIVTGIDDNTTNIWSLENEKPMAILKGHTSVVTSALFSPDGKYFITASWDNTAKLWNADNGQLLADLNGHSDWVNTVAFSPDGNYVITSSSDNTAKVWEVPSGKLRYTLQGHTDWVSSAIYSPDGNYILTTSWDNTAIIWSREDSKIIHPLQGHSGVIKSAAFSADGKYVITGSWDNTAIIWETSSGKLLHNLKGHTEKIRSVAFSPNGRYALTASWDSTAKVWETATGHLLYTSDKHTGALNLAAFSPDGKYIITTSMDNTARLWKTDNGQAICVFKGHTKPVIAASFSTDGEKVITASWDNTAKIWEATTGKLLYNLKGHTASLKSATFSPNGKYIITTSEDNTLKRWNAITGEFLYTFFPVDSQDWLAIDKESRYDGTEAARKMLYYVCGNEIINLEQFKNLSWEPNLVNKLTGLNKEPITAKNITSINLCNYTPVIEEKGVINGSYLYEIKERQGGIGEVQLYVNNKLVEEYSASQLKKTNNAYILAVPKEKATAYFIDGANNQVLVKATTGNGTMLSRGASVTVNYKRKEAAPPDMYIISIGVSKYKNEKLRLHYASKDAVDFSATIEKAARNLLNTDGNKHVHNFSFHTEEGSNRWPAKAALQKLIDSVAQKATAEDILVLFFAGHGVLLNGQKNFFLLTADASSLELNGIESEVAISTDELQNWLRKIKANKQILILDACNSGQVIEQFQQFITKRDMPADQKRALENLKDKTGLYILSASAAGQAAYEDIQYDQGLLTYSLLFGIKFGGGLKDNKFIDITRWFNFAADNVRTLARNIGGRQDPQILGNASFTVGIVDTAITEKIELSVQKKIFGRSRFIQDAELLSDDLNLSFLIDKELNELSGKGKESPLIFAADNNFQNAYSIRGRYSIVNNTVSSSIFLFRGQKEKLTQFQISGTTDKKEALVRNIIRNIQNYISDNADK